MALTTHDPLEVHTKEHYDELYNRVCSSVVMLQMTKHRPIFPAPFTGCTQHAIGFIVHCHKTEECTSMIAVHSYAMNDFKSVRVIFFDDVECETVHLVPKIEGLDFTILQVQESDRHDSLSCVDFCEAGVTTNGQEVFSIIPLMRRFCMFRSNVIQANCEAVNMTDLSRIEGSRDIFALKCPVASTLESDFRSPQGDNWLKRIIGTPIFNMNGKVVGTINSCCHTYDLKFGKQGRCFYNVLQKWLAANNGWEDIVSTHDCQPSVSEQADTKRRKI